MKVTISETAGYLDLPVSTLLRWIRQGKIPIQRKDEFCVFDPEVLKKWANEHNLPFSLAPQQNEDRTKIQVDTLLVAMMRGNVSYGIPGDGMEVVLEKAVDQIPGLSGDTRRQLLENLLERETMASTGLGKGVAIPHPRTPKSLFGRQAFIATFFLDKPVNYHAVDGEPVFVLFVLVSPEVKTHLHLLSRLAYCIRSDEFIAFLKTRPEADAFFSRVSELESRLDEVQT